MFEDENEWEDHMEDISMLLQKFDKLKKGTLSPYLFSFEEFETLIIYLTEEGAYKKGLDAISMAMDIFPNSIDLLILKADILVECDMTKEALITTREAKKIDDKNLNIIRLETEILCELDKEEEAVYLLSKMAESEENEGLKTYILHELISVYLIQKDYSSAYDALMEILALDKENESAFLRITYISFKANKLNETIEFLTEQLEESPLDYMLWINLADAHLYKANYDEAEEAYNIVLGLSPKNFAAHNGLIDTLMQKGDYDSAINHIHEYHQDKEPDHFMSVSLALCYEQKKDFAKAREVYMSFLQNFDFVREFSVYLNIAKTYIEEEFWGEALKNLDIALEFEKNESEIYALLAYCHIKKEDLEKALVYAEKALSMDEENPIYQKTLVEVMMQREEYSAAYEYIETLEEKDEVEDDLLYFKTVALILDKRQLEAETALYEALEQNSNLTDILYNYVPNFENYHHLNQIISHYKK